MPRNATRPGLAAINGAEFCSNLNIDDHSNHSHRECLKDLSNDEGLLRTSHGRFRSTLRSIGTGMLCLVASIAGTSSDANAQILNKEKLLAKETFWDNRDWDWYSENIPFFECPDNELNTTYYYRWELLTKHLTYGSPDSGYSFTEFIDRPFWSGAYGAISCPAGHQLYEARWLKKPDIAQDYLKYWFRTPGAQPRNYSTWIADSAWALHKVHPNNNLLVDLLPDLIRNYEGWEQRHFVPEVGLFWQTGHDDGMEFNINSRQTQDILRGAPSYRPSFNAYMWADAIAISRIAMLAGKTDVSKTYQQKADALKAKVQQLLWDEKRKFFFPVFKNDEERDGFKIKALTRTYESGKHAGSEYGRELIGYVPWQFMMLDTDRGYEASWEKLISENGFQSKFGPMTVERNDPMFLLMESCCWWSGQSWPYATSQTLKAMANMLHDDRDRNATNTKLPVNTANYVALLQTFSKSHRKDGRPYLAEALHPETGSFKGHDGYNHSEHYFHSSFCDLVITGLIGVREQSNNTLVIDPLAPSDWDYFALDEFPYHGQLISVFWDRTGTRYGHGSGLHVWMNGKEIGAAPSLSKLTVTIPDVASSQSNAQASNSESATAVKTSSRLVNHAVNNDGSYFPQVRASFTAPGTYLSKVNDGNYWYHIDPPNRWTAMGSPSNTDWVDIDLGMEREVEDVKLYFLEDSKNIAAPKGYQVQLWENERWVDVSNATRHPEQPTSHRSNSVRFAPRKTSKVRIVLTHADGSRSGLTEVEVWGKSELPYVPAPPPKGNIAFNAKREGFPKASASHFDRFGGNPWNAIDGKIVFPPTPMNRWTSYESKEKTDWFEIDFGKSVTAGRVELYIYDDRGGVQAPLNYRVECWENDQWVAVTETGREPQKPAGGIVNSVRFTPRETTKLRVVFTNAEPAKSGLTEIEVWAR